MLFIAILALRRIPNILLLYKFVPDIHNWREALFCGHFGECLTEFRIEWSANRPQRSDGCGGGLHLHFGHHGVAKA